MEKPKMENLVLQGDCYGHVIADFAFAETL